MAQGLAVSDTEPAVESGDETGVEPAVETGDPAVESEDESCEVTEAITPSMPR